MHHLIADSLGVYVPSNPLDIEERRCISGVGKNEDGVLLSQALVVTAGPFKGRICLNDDDDFLLKKDASKSELLIMKKAGIHWEEIECEPDDDGETYNILGVGCEVVTFGYYMTSIGTYSIPRQILRPATMKDLIQRYQEISDLTIVYSRNSALGKSTPYKLLYELFNEQLYISEEIRHRDEELTKVTSKKNVFLCHSSDDKQFVRSVGADLYRNGHSVWIDEFEIKVGDSIVDKINNATAEADALVLFISQTSISSDWVKREWNSALARSLSGDNIVVLPVLIEDAKIPSIMSDIKYADFRKSYTAGLDSLLIALNNILSNKTEGKGA